jgi:hypothetical protein
MRRDEERHRCSDLLNPSPVRGAALFRYFHGRLVDLDEGVCCLSRILAGWDELEPDLRVRLEIRDSTPVRLFNFVLDKEARA